ncbi:MAG TPA: Clp protease N-terminal domain-containing protein [Candidatus Dormibacteraeota bacterium]|nr:Clp protease N-terminal domain-containing protein [Candidatus Dormibacteraeota bacterium]
MPNATIALDRASADIPLTRAAREDLERAANEAAQRGAEESNPVDVLRAVLSNRGSLAITTIRSLGTDPAVVATALSGDGAASTLPLRQLLVNANREAQVLGHYSVDSIHLLLALLYSDSPATSAALQRAGLTMYDLRRHLQTGARPDAPIAAAPPSAARAPDRALRRRPLPRLRGVVTVSPIFLALLGVVAVTGAVLWFDVLPQYVTVVTVAFVAAGWIATLCVHEFSHALAGYLGGDTSMPSSGYLSLNPLRYTHLLMSIALPAVFLLLGGIPLPGGAVYINTAALRGKRWETAVALAGPLGTLVCGLVIAGAMAATFRLGVITRGNLEFFAALAFLGAIEMYVLVLTLLPVPPLDGFAAIRPWLPYGVQAWASRIGWYGLVLLFFAIWYVPAIGAPISGAGDFLSGLVGLDPSLVSLGAQNFRFR